MSYRFTSLVAISFPLAACGGDGAAVASGDGGAGPSKDAGVRADAGAHVQDTGTRPMDTGKKDTSSRASDSGVADSGSDGAVAQCPGTGAAGYNPYKYAYYGDLHQHTSFSLDAYSFGTRTDPATAYLFAKGQASVSIGSATSNVAGPVITQARPIDFLAITDHSEWLFVTHGCTIDQDSGYYSSASCGLVRSTAAVDQNSVFADLGKFKNKICTAADAGAECNAEEKTAWQQVQSAAATANAPCQFSSLVAYEWTDTLQVVDEATDAGTNATNHRNVIFATDKVPAAPLDSIDYPKPPALWAGLDTQCVADAGCEVVTIPHNTDLSGGVSLVVWNPTPAGVAQQRRYQVSAEIYQHKAGSECYYSPAEGYNDPDCQFEYPSPTTAVNIGPASFVREGLGTGLGYAAVNPTQGNPLKLGIVGATDDHNGAPGNVNEAKYVGHAGRLDDTPYTRLANSPENGSGALTGAWAEQNTRASIFAAIKRRETFATSGPRLQVRFYQTRDATACADPEFPKKIIDAATGRPMGSTFGTAAIGGSGGPTFALTVWPDSVAQELADGTTAVAGIATVQVIKVHAHTNAGQPVVVEDPPNVVSGIPAAGGCGTWTDASFDPTEYAVYYVRALQVPTWRWSHWSCAALKANNPTTWQTLVPGCVAGGPLDISIQERAWTSPIWFEPG